MAPWERYLLAALIGAVVGFGLGAPLGLALFWVTWPAWGSHEPLAGMVILLGLPVGAWTGAALGALIGCFRTWRKLSGKAGPELPPPPRSP